MEATKVIRTAYAGVREFNDIAGNLTNVTDESIDAQLGFCFEELSEAIEAFEAGDKAEFLKEACDMFVVLGGLLQKMEAQGYNVAQALLRVNENNLSKFPKVGEVFGNPEKFTLYTNPKYNRVVLKDANGKVRKPSTYAKVDLSDLVGAK